MTPYCTHWTVNEVTKICTLRDKEGPRTTDADSEYYSGNKACSIGSNSLITDDDNDDDHHHHEG